MFDSSHAMMAIIPCIDRSCCLSFCNRLNAQGCTLLVLNSDKSCLMSGALYVRSAVYRFANAKHH